MRLVTLSDTHGQHRSLKPLPDGDVLIHAGDSLRKGTLSELIDFCDWFSKQKHRYKIMIAGNHDWVFEKDHYLARNVIPSNIEYLEDSGIDICGKTFYGAPWTPKFFDWAFMQLRRDEIRKKWDLIPDRVDVLVTHGPPYGHGDLAPPYQSPSPRTAGCLELLLRISEAQPKYHIYGHIHAGYGITQSDEIPATTFINTSICNEQYTPINPPKVIDM